MDFSNYKKTHSMFSNRNAGQLGYLKDEMRGECQIYNAIALKSKCYSLRTDSAINKCKGIPKVASSRLKFKDYKKALLQRKRIRTQFHKIASKDHCVTTTKFDRKSLSFYDDKRFYTCDVHSLPYGHFRLKTFKNFCDKCPN